MKPASSDSHFPRSLLVAAAAAVLFVPLFVLRGIGPLDFWWWMSINILILTGLGAVVDRGYFASIRRDLSDGVPRKIILGILAAAFLYAVFYGGNWLSRLVLPFAEKDIGRVYGFKAGAPLLRIALSMIFVIGPGEELFWRAFLQRSWQARFGPISGWLAATALYALVHAGSGNPMLVLAAAVCGLFWGFLYMKTGSFLLVAVSHTAWDAAVFLLFPFQ
jgi:membrane protease YdiL (CAAX protease family)